MRARAVIAMSAAFVVVGLAPGVAWAHGDARLVDEVVVLAPGDSASFAGDVHYHRLVGEVSADGPVRVRLVAAASGDDVLTVGSGKRLAVNALVRCCDEAWAPHLLVIDNLTDRAVTVSARMQFVHDDLAVMVDAAEPGTRASIVLMGLGWWALVWHAARRRPASGSLGRPAVGLAVLAAFVVGVGSYATLRYGTGGPPAVLAGSADLPVIPLNPIVSRASLLVGVAIVGWVVVGLWWVRARGAEPRVAWVALGVGLAGAAATTAVAVLLTYGGPLVQTAWLVASVTPVVVLIVSHVRGSAGLTSAGHTSPAPAVSGEA